MEFGAGLGVWIKAVCELENPTSSCECGSKEYALDVARVPGMRYLGFKVSEHLSIS